MILDSCFIIDLLAGDDAAVAKLDELTDAAEQRSISAISVVEIERGLGDDGSSKAREAFEDVVDRLDVVPFGLTAAREAGRVHRQLDGDGEGVGTLDGMIAAAAIARDGRVLTRNVSEFRRIDGVRPVPY